MSLFFVSTGMIIYLLCFSPFEDPFFTKIEVMNEVTAIFLLYTMLCFTDWIPSAERRYIYGWFFIGFASLNMIVHIFLLFKENFYVLYLVWVRYLNK